MAEIPYITPAPNFAAAIWIMLAFIIMTTAARVYCRQHVLKAFGLDDTLIVIATVFAIAQTALQQEKVSGWYPLLSQLVANGVDENFAKQPSITYAERLSFLARCLYVIELGFFKTSIFAFYLRFVQSKSQRILMYAMMALVATITVVYLILFFVSYQPFEGFWYFRIRPDARFKVVLQPTALEISSSSLQIFIDVTLLVVPVLIFRRIQIAAAKKTMLVVVYLFGFVSLAATIARLPQTTSLKGKVDSIGLLTQNIVFTIWTQVELATGIVCANIPALSALLRRKVMEYGSRQSQPYGSQSNHPNSKSRGSGKNSYHRRWSEESSERLNVGGPEHAIVRNTEFAVEYELADNSKDIRV